MENMNCNSTINLTYNTYWVTQKNSSTQEKAKEKANLNMKATRRTVLVRVQEAQEAERDAAGDGFAALLPELAEQRRGAEQQHAAPEQSEAHRVTEACAQVQKLLKQRALPGHQVRARDWLQTCERT